MLTRIFASIVKTIFLRGKFPAALTSLAELDTSTPIKEPHVNKVFLLIALCAGATAFADGLIHLQSSDQTEIFLSYRTTLGDKDLGDDYALTGFIVAPSSNSSCTQQVRVVVTTTCPGEALATSYTDLSATQSDRGCRYESAANNVATLERTKNGQICSQKISIVMNGDWLVDPVSKTHDFVFVLN
jgi:hypothetical protein